MVKPFKDCICLVFCLWYFCLWCGPFSPALFCTWNTAYFTVKHKIQYGCEHTVIAPFKHCHRLLNNTLNIFTAVYKEGRIWIKIHNRSWCAVLCYCWPNNSVLYVVVSSQSYTLSCTQPRKQDKQDPHAFCAEWHSSTDLRVSSFYHCSCADNLRKTYFEHSGSKHLIACSELILLVSKMFKASRKFQGCNILRNKSYKGKNIIQVF